MLPVQGPVVTPLPELMDREIADPLWVVPRLLPEGLCLFAGKPKMGKSWLGLDLALTCALGTALTGRHVLGHYAVAPTSVLYLSLEDSEKRLQNRVRKLVGSRSVPATFDYALQWRPLNTGGLTDLETWLMTASQPAEPTICAMS